MNKKIMKGMLGLMALTALSINTSQAQTQPQDNLGGFTTKNTQKMDCDSTCIVPGSMDKSKVNIGVTSKDVGQFKWGPKCGASAGSVLPSAPTSFLCDTGNTASPVSTTTSDGETKYSWTCTNPGGSAVQCDAVQREVAMCGSDNRQSLSANPSNLCSTGQATGFSLLGNQYKWICQGNYGAQASCSATYYVPPPPDPSPGSGGGGGSCWQESVEYVSFYEASTGRTCSGSTGVEKCYWGMEFMSPATSTMSLASNQAHKKHPRVLSFS